MKKMLKKMTLGFLGLFGFLAIGAGTLGISSQANAQWINGWFDTQDNTFNPNVAGHTGMAETSLLETIKNFINWVLGLLSLIALIVLLWGGFQMVTAAGDENKYKAGFTILKQAGIGLAFIALSWLIVSLIFFVIGAASWGGGTGQ